MSLNGVLLQTFNWNFPSTQTFYQTLETNCSYFKQMGITSLWLPPVSKGVGGKLDVGYGIYDHYDLGEFEQKGSLATKYGTKAELERTVLKCRKVGLQVYSDMVYNHRLGGDTTEKFSVVQVDSFNRLNSVSQSTDVVGWTQFLYSNRSSKYSTFKLKSYHFVGIDFKQNWQYEKSVISSQTIYRILGQNKFWSNYVSKELGNYDYLLGNDLDLNHPEVVKELINFSLWLVQLLSLDGLRIDAAKHIDYLFLTNLLTQLRKQNPNLFVVAEYWMDSLPDLTTYLNAMQFSVALFDVPLHYNLYKVSNFNLPLNSVFQNTLVEKYPIQAVTFVDNHDTEPGQSLQSYVSEWFRTHAYALILLREGGYPTIFYTDLIQDPNTILAQRLKLMLDLRRKFNLGSQVDLFDYPTCVAWYRSNLNTSLPAMVVLLNSGDLLGYKVLTLSKLRANQTCTPQFKTKAQLDFIQLDAQGSATFYVPAKDAQVYICS